MLNDRMLQYIREHEKEAYELLLTIAKIPAPSNHEEKRAAFCEQWLKDQGAEGVYVDEALNVVYPVDAEGEKPLQVYMAHTDVVFADETELPLKIADGRIYCPGVGDDTACLVCVLLAAKFAAEIIKNGTWREIRDENAPGLLFVCNAGEEGLGNLKGVRKICEVYGNRMESFCSFDCQLDTVVNHAVGSKRFKVTVRTEGGHSYANFGNGNAIEKLSGMIQKLYQVQVPKEGKTTYNVGLISGGTSVNTIAQEAWMYYEFRSDSREGLAYMENVLNEILGQEKAAGVDVSCEVLGLRPCAGDIDPKKQAALEERAMKAAEAATGKRPHTEPASTDCNIPMSMGIPSVCMGSFYGYGAHKREEYVEIDSLPLGYRAAFEMIFGQL